MEKLCGKIYIREICKLGFEGEIYVMKEKKSTNKILVSISLAFGIFSLFSFVLYFYRANHAPYTYIDAIFLGPLFSFIGIVISIITRKSRKIHPVLWISGIISCMLGLQRNVEIGGHPFSADRSEEHSDAQITMNVYNHIAEKSHVENEMSKMNLPETVPAVV